MPNDTPPPALESAMKLGMNLLLWTGYITEEQYPVMAKIKAAGYDGVELPIFDEDVARYKTIRTELDKQGLKCTAVTVMNPEANPISPDASIRTAAVERLKKIIEINHVLGSEALC